MTGSIDAIDFDWERKLVLQRHHVRTDPDVMCKCTKSLDRITEIKGMAFAWCDTVVSTESTSQGLAFNVLGTCTTTLGDTIYTLQKVRLLLPSAHRLWRAPSPLEVQFVHDAACGDRLVLVALFQEGEPSFDVHSAIGSLLLERAPVRLIDLVPLCRCFFVHDVSDTVGRGQRQETHMVSFVEMVIACEQLAELHARMTSHPRNPQR